jgi:hypothetical protein
MSWIIVTRPDGKSVPVNDEHIVVIRPGASQPGCACTLILVNGLEEVQETMDQLGRLIWFKAPS